jgi:hypothetical protein
MTTTQWLLGWWNLVFLVPFSLALLYLGLYVVSGVTFGDADADADVDADAHVDVDADADVDVDADAAADVDADADADADADGDHDGHHGGAHHGRSSAMGALAWVGVGRVPLSLVLMVLLLTWGFTGFVANQFLRTRLPRTWMIPLVSLPLAALGAASSTRLLTRAMSRLMPTEETYARRRSELLGEVGEAIYAIDERFGMAAVRDDRGNLFQVPCRVEPGRPPVAKGSKVLLVSYDANGNIYHVMPDEGGVLARGDGSRAGRSSRSRAGLTKGGLS